MFDCIDNGPRFKHWKTVVVIVLLVIVFALGSMPRPFGELLLTFSTIVALMGGVLGLRRYFKQQHRSGSFALT
jgi:ABC-type transport system involved in cytochrome c biogenesis permease component